MSEDQKQPVEEKNEDNLMAELNAFNEGSSPEESKEEAKAESSEAKLVEEHKKKTNERNSDPTDSDHKH